jgi:hypothetical protein
MIDAEAKASSPTYGALVDGANSMEELLRVARAVKRLGDHDGVIADIISRGEIALATLQAKAADVRPSRGLVVWNRGNRAALTSYNPSRCR